MSRPGSDSFLRGGILLPRRACDCDGDRKNDEVVVTATVGGDITTSVGGEEVAKTTVTVVDVDKLPEITVTAMTEDGAGPLMELAEGSTYKVKVEANRNQPSGEVTSEDRHCYFGAWRR